MQSVGGDIYHSVGVAVIVDYSAGTIVVGPSYRFTATYAFTSAGKVELVVAIIALTTELN